MPNFAYAVMYELSGRFFLASKFQRGYYFSSGGGRIVPNGQPLNGAGDYALPGGGQRAQENVEAACRREWHEETGTFLPAGTFHTWAAWDDDINHYSAGYFLVDQATFNNLTLHIANTNLPEGADAQQNIIDGYITQYREIHQTYPHAPPDNELSECTVWDVRDDTNWQVIQGWQGDRNKSWYYTILYHLKYNVLPQALNPGLDRHEMDLAIERAREYMDSLKLPDDPPDPDIADSDGLVTYINASTNTPPPHLIEERTKMSATLEGLVGIVTAAVLRTAGDNTELRHEPKQWTDPMINGLGPFFAGYQQETVTYDRQFAGVELATQFLNILMDAVTNAGAALDSFKRFLEQQGETIKLHGEHTAEGYKYACIGMVHELFEVEPGTWIYVPKIRAYFSSFTRETFKVTSSCASFEHVRFRFTMQKMIMGFKIETWRQDPEFRKQVDDFVKKYTKANIKESENYFDGIFNSAKP